MKISAFLFSSLFLVQACANNAITPEDKMLLNSVQLEPSKESVASIEYRGKGSSFLSHVSVGVGVGTGIGRGGAVGAGVGTNLGREPTSELDGLAMENKIDIDAFMAKDFKARASEAGVVFVDSAPKLKLTAHSTKILFEGVLGNPTLTAEADFVLKEGNRVVWKYTAEMEGSGKGFPSYSREELMNKDNLSAVLKKAAEILTDDAIKNLKKSAAAT
ncbi:MAG: hypothetical protein EOP04_14210 [Proteobacteria bacterium]|nr:MAG: hypothetical protein EOP04_14210 [Pseudomonadota bacterium]